MKFMCHWQVHPDKRSDVLSGFAAMDLNVYQTLQGPTVKIVGRWHDMANLTGVAICETDDLEALELWLMMWQDACDFEVLPCLDDAEAHAAAKKFVAAS